MSYKRFCGLANASTIPDRTTVWTFENRIGEAGKQQGTDHGFRLSSTGKPWSVPCC